MALMDGLIAVREAVLNLVLRTPVDQVLNAGPVVEAKADAEQVAAEVKRAINAFKAAAIDASGSRVDYSGLRESKAYAEYRRTCTPQLRALDLRTLETREERLAFWINLYNALTIDAVIAFGIQRSVTEGFAGIVRFFRRATYDVGGQRFSSEEIEHGVLRANLGHPYIPGPQFGPSDPRRACMVAPLDPRIHFALNCASRSCPPIGVYDAATIDAQLDLATRNFVDGETSVDPTREEIRLSSIFRWYSKDFGGQAGIIEFLLRNLPDDERQEWLAANRSKARLAYQPYDWSLNT